MLSCRRRSFEAHLWGRTSKRGEGHNDEGGQQLGELQQANSASLIQACVKQTASIHTPQREIHTVHWEQTSEVIHASRQKSYTRGVACSENVSSLNYQLYKVCFIQQCFQMQILLLAQTSRCKKTSRLKQTKEVEFLLKWLCKAFLWPNLVSFSDQPASIVTWIVGNNI